MLNRLAGNLFWLGRYLERAENVARTLGVSERLAHAPEHHRNPGPLWTETLMMCCDETQFRKTGAVASADVVLDWCFMGLENPSSVVNCLRSARDNARTARHLLTSEAWVSVNGAWIESWDWSREAVEFQDGWEEACHWATRRCLQVRGAFLELPRGELPHVLTLGRAIERAAFIGTILQLSPITAAPPGVCPPGSPLQRRTEAALRSAGGLDTFGRGSRKGICPRDVVDFLIGDPVSPRSLLVASREIVEALICLTGGETAELDKSLPAAQGLVAQVEGAAKELGNPVETVADIVKNMWALSDCIQREHFAIPEQVA
jgi:uncharacterized alpha-E superfamily protein